MKKIILIGTLFFSSLAWGQSNTDLELPEEERWLAEFDKYICNAFEPETETPDSFKNLNVNFSTAVLGYTLDNVLLKATYEDSGSMCQYSALLFADNDTQTYKFVQSKAFDSTTGDEAICAPGKSVLDQAFVGNKYLYYGHPHNAAIMISGVGEKSVCGSGAQSVGVNFVMKGMIK